MMRISLPRRSGVTLSEILISMLVMSIGVVSLATLFPISILRSIQATQLTNATIHRLNAEQLVGLFPRLVHDPDNDGNLAEHEVAGGIDNPDNTVDGINEGRFIVDPQGATDAGLATVSAVFGNDNGAATTNPINRYHAGFTTVSTITASDIDYLPDTWQTQAKGTITGGTDNQITVPANIDLNLLQSTLSSNVPTRLVVFSNDGKQSVVRTLNSTTTTVTLGTYTIDWSTLGQPLPAVNNQYYNDADNSGTFTAGDTIVASRFRIETYEPRYSWLLTVRKTPNPTTPGQGTANVDIVVFHKRPFSAAAEQVFTVKSWIGNQCTLDLSATNSLASKPKPFLKKGGYLFDAQHAHWYRITQLVEDSVNPVLTLDRNVIAPINPMTGVTVPPTRVMAIAGVVEIYPIEPITYDSNNPP